jgi:hypothetical protein
MTDKRKISDQVLLLDSDTTGAPSIFKLQSNAQMRRDAVLMQLHFQTI